QVRAEIERNSRFRNILILAKSKEAFEQVINEFNTLSYILQYKSFKVLPFEFGTKYLSVFHSEKIVHEYLKSYDVHVLSTEDNSQSGLPVLVEHEGEEK